MTKTFITLILGAAALLAGCDSKPPGCADPETLQTAKSVLTDPLALKPERAAEIDPDGMAAGFVNALKLDVSNIVSEGYQADKKKQMCKGMLRVTLPDGKGLEREISYSTQRTVDQKDRFMLEIENAQPIIIQLAFARDGYVSARRWSGNWGGTYSCLGIGDAADGPQGPFSMPVTMTVDGTTAKLERVTKGGGVETLAGELNGSLKLAGTGANSAEDKWETTFHGQASGRKVTAEGLIRLADGTILRRCKLDLAQGAAAPAAATATAAAAATPAPASAATPTPATESQVPAGSAVSQSVPTPPAAATASLCSGGEQVFFACSTGKKLVSLCASPSLTAEAGTLTYRVGAIGQPPELQHPSAGAHPKTAFKRGSLTYSGGGGAFVSFDRGEFRYVVFSASGSGWSKDGVVVEKAGKRVAHLACSGTVTSSIEGETLKSVGVPEDTRSVELP